jgi:hypothetical protein
MLESMMSGIKGTIQWVIERLPDSPFQALDVSPISEYLGMLNWIVPVEQMIYTLGLWVTCIAIFYIYSVVMKWVKAI